MQSTNEVYFVFLGESLPRYAASSIDLAIRHSGMSIHLLGNEKLRRQVGVDGVSFTAVEDFYNPLCFVEAAERVSLPQSFRDGFWLKTLERFFVLEQFMESAGLSDIFHAELDQLLFRTDLLVEKLRLIDTPGLFVPFHNKNVVVASVLYCNDRSTFRSLLEYSRQSATFKNEMELLGAWSAQYPQSVLALPTLKTLHSGPSNQLHPGIKALSVDQIGGVVDAAQIGQWVGGIDPRNVSLRQIPTTKFSDIDTQERNLISPELLTQLRFEQSPVDGSLTMTIPNLSIETRIFNLHLHSKIHSWIQRSNVTVDELLRLSNLALPARIPGTRRTQIVYHLTTRVVPLARSPRALFRTVTFHLIRRFGGWLAKRRLNGIDT